jgi:nucleotide sugar dehydrogenase
MSTDLIVMGLGYVGLPLARAAMTSGLRVVGFDANPRVDDGLNEGRSHVDDITDDDIRRMLDLGFRASADPADLDDARIFVICVPTPLSADGAPDLSAVVSATEVIGAHLSPGALVVLESTSFPGTTEEIIQPILEERSGLRAGPDFSLAFSPERIDPGNREYGIQNTPKVVGGVTESCSTRAREFYERFIDRVVVGRGTREAETAKLLENTYRHINIALVNELVVFGHQLGIDVWEAIDAAATKPFGYLRFEPGPGVGGHCIPIDPNYLSHRVRSRLGYPFRFVELAQEINATMPAYVAHRAQDILNRDGMAINGASVLLLGVTYKADIADERESPAVPLATHLLGLGARVFYHDPLVETWSMPQATRLTSLDQVADVDLVILLQQHSDYDVEELAARSLRFFDTRGVTRGAKAHRL